MADGSVPLFFEEILPGSAPTPPTTPPAASEKTKETLTTRATLTFRWRAVSQRGDRPAARGGHTLTLVGENALALFGGADRGGEPRSDLYLGRYDAEDGSCAWTRVPQAGQWPPARAGHTAVAAADGSRLYVYGGMGEGGGFLSDVWELDCAARTWSRVEADGEAPRRNGHSAALVGGGRRMVVLGGSDRVPQTGVHELDLDARRWRRVPTEGDPGPPREMHAAAALPPCPETGLVTVRVVGGRTRDGLAGTALCLDAPADASRPYRWRADGDAPALCGHAAVAIGGCVAVHGGTDGQSFSNALLFGTKGGQWVEAAGETPAPRFVHALAPLPARFTYALFGGIRPDAELADMHELRVEPGMVAE